MLLWLAVFWEAADLVSFGMMMGTWGLRAEVNPLAHGLASITGEGLAIVALLAIKAALIAYLIWLYRLIPSRPRLRSGVLILATIAGLVGGISNLLTV